MLVGRQLLILVGLGLCDDVSAGLCLGLLTCSSLWVNASSVKSFLERWRIIWSSTIHVHGV